MRTDDFDYNLPPELIAQEPAEPRDHSRLLVLDKKSGKIEHKYFYDIVDYLRSGDLLVMNDSKVIKARLIGHKSTGGEMEVFLVNKVESPQSPKGTIPQSPFIKGVKFKGVKWKCLVRGKARIGMEIGFEMGLKGVLKGNNACDEPAECRDGTWEVEFNVSEDELMSIIDSIGEVPLPPYIQKKKGEGREEKDVERYQTVFANDEKKGSVAAPTAGLHFTPELLQKIKDKGIEIAHVTLHVGLGTFAPIKVDNILEHKMHSEYVEIEAEVIEKIIKAKQEGRRVIAIGTTSCRSIEAMAIDLRFTIDDLRLNNKKIENPVPTGRQGKSKIENYSAWVNIFIYPGYEFKVVDAMITNFHLPKSTLMMLVSAFACTESSRSDGKDKIDKAYKSAIESKYRFFSYGDAMFIR